ncbi:MAG TPA: VCBS repeat-containing protein, partial [Blastocatellia bacterium]
MVNDKSSKRPVLGRFKTWFMMTALLMSLSLPAYSRVIAATGHFFSPQSQFASSCTPQHNRANFDGDCKTDISVFDRSTGAWNSVNSSNQQYVSFSFGQSGDIPTPGDYNGDGKTDR